MKTQYVVGMALAGVLAAGLSLRAGTAQAEERGNEHPWTVSLAGGYLQMEGDATVKGGFVSSVIAGYDYSQSWTFEGLLSVAPQLRGGTVNRFDPAQGRFVEINRLVEQTGERETWAGAATVDALYHFTRWKRVDPYLTLGVGALKYGVDINENDGWDVELRGGGGIMYHFNDEWTARVDARGFLAGTAKRGSADATYEAGLCWTIGAHVPPAYVVSGGAKDSDMDGLTDDEEINVYHTDPLNPDTDGDGLTDFEEVKTYHTDPLNPDSDYDMLKDGDEVHQYHTNPLDPDTDKGGVSDGHEVLDDHTNPLDPKDDLQLFTLNINFEYDRTEIKPDYFNDLDVIGKVLQRDPGATATIEGHADKLKYSVKQHNDELSLHRAQSVMDYLATKPSIDRSRMKAVGYGFSRPKAPNDKINGNPVNRRVEVYIRKSSQQEAAKVKSTPPAVEPVEPAPVAPAATAAPATPAK